MRVESNANANGFLFDGGTGQLGIGVAPSAGTSMLTLAAAGNGSIQAGIDFDDTNSGDGYRLYANAGNFYIRNYDDGQTDLQVTAGGDTTIARGDLIFGTAGKGVVLGATSNTDANTLDDYEEGTWTPSISSTSGGSDMAVTATGDYTKVGNWVNFNIFRFANVDTTGASGEMRITGLPFTVGNSQITTNIATHKFTFDPDKFQWAEIGGGGTTISFLESQNNGVWTNWNITAGSGRYLAIAGAYRV